MAAGYSKQEMFETMPVGKALATMAIPTITSQLITLIYNMVDTIYIGRTGDVYKTAAVTLTLTLVMMTNAFGNLMGVGGGSLIARLEGKGEREKARGVCAFSFYGAVAISLLYALVVGVFMEPLLMLMGGSVNTIGFAKQYTLLVIVVGGLPMILSMVAAHLLRNAGYSKQASMGLSMGGLLNILLDPLFMFVLLPDGMEVVGAAVATMLSNVISCIYLVVVIYRVSGGSPLCIQPSRIRVIGKREVQELFSVGIPSALLIGLFDIANICLNALMAAHGDLQLAGLGIVLKAERLPTAINLGICQGMIPIVAYNYSSGDHQRMNRVIWAARKAGLTVSAVTLVLYQVFAPLICGVFLNTSAGNEAEGLLTIGFAVTFLRVRCVAAFFQFLNYNTSYSMQAVGYGSGTLLHSLVRILGCYIPAMLIFNHLFGMYGLVAAFPIGELCGGLFALFLFGRWKKKKACVQQTG